MADAQDLGAVVTAGLAAGEMDGAAARQSGDLTRHPATCANCRQSLIGHFCHGCGQSAHVHRSAAGILHDIGHGVFHFEGKVAHTLPMLAFRPGQLTRRYIDGERTRFVSPMALFLFSVFLMFASIGLWSNDLDMQGVGRNLVTVQSDVTLQEKEAGQSLVKAIRRRAEAVQDGNTGDIAEHDARIADAREDVRALAKVKAALGETRLAKDPKQRDLDVNTGFKALDVKVKQAFDNPQLAMYKIKTAAYKFSWALIPISLPFIWLLFPFSRRFGFYDHAIFATYSLAFMTLLVVAASIVVWLGVSPAVAWLCLFLVPPVHLYAQLKGTYGLRRPSALTRTAVLLFFTLITISLFATLLAWLGLA